MEKETEKENENEKENEKEKETAEESKEDDPALIEFYSSFRDLFEFFCLNTTIHGTVRLVCSNHNKMKTVFWGLLFLACFGMLYWQFALLFSQYWAYAVITSLSVHSEPKMFPAVTVCSLNPYRIDTVARHMVELDDLAREMVKNLYRFDIPAHTLKDHKNLRVVDLTNEAPSRINGSGFRLDRSISLVKMGRKVGFRLCNATGGACYDVKFSSGVDAVREWYRFHYTNIMSQVPSVFEVPQDHDNLVNMVYSCQYDGQYCRHRDAEYFHHPTYGSCYTYNKNGKDDFWKAYKPGIVYGLSLIVKVERKDHIPLLSTLSGMKVMIHNHNQTPFLEHEGFDIRPGIKSTIKIRQDEVNRLGEPYGECNEKRGDVNVRLIYNSTYTMQACLYSCFQHQMIEKCGCGYYYYPLPPGAEYCNYNKNPSWGHCFYLLYKQLTDHELSCFEECPKPCKQKWYTLSAGYADWPSEKSEDWIHKVLLAQSGYNRTTDGKDIAKVNIYFEKLDYMSWDESAEYTETIVMSNMGSQWSLWFGSSVLSVVELFEFVVDTIILTLIFFYRRLTAKRTHNISSPPKVPSVSLTLEKYRHVEEGTVFHQNTAATEAMENSSVPAFPKGTPLLNAKHSKNQVPELYSEIVLHSFRHRGEHCIEMGPNS